MRLIAGVLFLIAALLASAHTARADTHCYEFRNDSNEVVALTFSYHPAIGNVITGAAIDPGKTYPFDGRPWCWNLPEEVTATVAVSGRAAPRWKGSLVLGNRSDTAPSGTYALGPPNAAATGAGAPSGAAAASAAAATSAAANTRATPSSAAKTAAASPSETCLANSYPNNEAYCLTGLQTDVKVECGMGHTGISGSIVIDHLTLQCRSGRKLRLTCGTTTGGRQKCAINDYRICTDEHVRNAAEFCSE